MLFNVVPLAFAIVLTAGPAFATDHNEPDIVNSIFTDVEPDAADLYGVFGWPKTIGGKEHLVVIATFAPAPKTGVFDPEVMHRIVMLPSRRLEEEPGIEFPSLGELGNSYNPRVAAGVASKLFKVSTRASEKLLEGITIGRSKAPEVRVFYADGPNGKSVAKFQFLNFGGGTQSAVVMADQTSTVQISSKSVKLYAGGKDDPFFTDLRGVFKSFNYLPGLPIYFPRQYSKMTRFKEPKEENKPKSLLVLNRDNSAYYRDDNGRVKTIFDESLDSRAGYNVNAIALEIPVSLLAKGDRSKRQVRVWGESYRRNGAAGAAGGPSAALRQIPTNKWLKIPSIIAGDILKCRRARDNSYDRYDIKSARVMISADRASYKASYHISTWGWDKTQHVSGPTSELEDHITILKRMVNGNRFSWSDKAPMQNLARVVIERASMRSNVDDKVNYCQYE